MTENRKDAVKPPEGAGPAIYGHEPGIPDTCRDAFSGLFRRSGDGMVVTDGAGALVAWNPAMEHLTGVAGSAVSGKQLSDVLFQLLPLEKQTPEQAGLLRQQVISSLRQDGAAEPVRSRHEICCPGSPVRVLESCMIALPAGNAAPSGVAIFHDVTAYRQSVDAVRELNRDLNRMFSVSRHDINNQLTILDGYLSLLETGIPSMKTEEIIRILQRASAKIQRILKFTRDYQEIRAKPPEWQNIGDAIRIARTLSGPGPVRVSCSETCDRTVIYADPTLVRVFFNLIENSLRHGEKVSEIRIGCRQDEHRLVLEYGDDGIGIMVKARDVLFERGKGKDTGYGLFLAREILAVTGLSIAETGRPGTGARFEITVPEGLFRLAGK